MKKKSSSRSTDARALIALFLFASAGCLVASGTLLASFRSEPSPQASKRAITFAERVAYQYAIEEVYWRHRIWPKDNSEPKPPLDAVISGEEVEKKVTDYLGKSQILTGHWQQPITAGQLQAEMERMARHTKQPDVLRELFEGLGNDPLVIAECLARPILAERLVSELTNPAALPVVNSTGSFDFTQDDMAANLVDAAYKLPEISVLLDCTNDTWTATVLAPDARLGHTAVWTGSEMVVWGGANYSNGNLNTGGRYNPATDSWTATSTTNAPTARVQHSAVWTGREMIIWGGFGGSDLNTGGRYNPTNDSWTASSTANVPLAREYHRAVWTGSEMIVWGGNGCGGNCNLNTGGRYNPTTDSWTATSTTNAPSVRWEHTAIWTGNEMIIWAGTNSMNYLQTGGRYNPAADSWTVTSVANVPAGRVDHREVWTGSEMIVWGGVDNGLNDLNTGGRYDPANDNWVPTTLANAPLPRDSHSAVWTGSEMIIWGGHHYPPGEDVNTGGRYNLASDSWTPTGTANVPVARHSHTAVWTGNEMIVWGGMSYDTGIIFNTGGRYCAQPSTPMVQSAVSRKRQGGAGNFDVDLPLSGTPGIECRSGGTTSDYTIVVTFLANVSVNGDPQATVSSGIGTIGSGGVSNGGTVRVAGNIVTIPLTNVANAQTLQVTLNNVNGSTNVTIPMRVLIGDGNGNGSVNASDIALTKSRIGQPINPTTFRSDVNADGSLNATDVSLVKSKVGTGLP